MTKRQIRNLMHYANLDMGLDERNSIAEYIFNQVEQTAQFAEAKCIAIYISLDDELPTRNAIERWHSAGKRVAIPRVESQTEMEFYEYQPDMFTIGSYSICEPTGTPRIEPHEIDFMVLPGVAFCLDGSRLGRGKGYYDRYLAREGFRAYTLGVCYPHQLLNSIPSQPHDKVLSRIITDESAQSTLAPVSSIILSTVDAAGVDASRLGCSVEFLIDKGLTWVLLRYTMHLHKRPSLGEKIEIETWISDCNRVSTRRNFKLRNSQGDMLGEITTQWCIIDLNERHAVDLTSSAFNYPQYVESRPFALATPPRRFASFESPTSQTSHHTVTQRDIDFNQHVNTIRYIDMMLDMLPDSLKNSPKLYRADIQFISEARLDETLTITKNEQPLTDNKQSLFKITHPDGSPSAKGLFEWL